DKTLSDIFGSASIEYNKYEDIRNLDSLGYSTWEEYSIAEVQRNVGENVSRAIAVLKQIAEGFREDIEDFAPVATSLAKPSQSVERKVFVVHGHDEGAKEGVARFLE